MYNKRKKIGQIKIIQNNLNPSYPKEGKTVDQAKIQKVYTKKHNKNNKTKDLLSS